MKFPKKLSKYQHTKSPIKERLSGDEISNSLKANKSYLEKVFSDFHDIVYRKIRLFEGSQAIEAILIYVDSLIDINILNESMIKPLNLYRVRKTDGSLVERNVLDHVEGILQTSRINRVTCFEEAISSILQGSTLLLLDGFNQAFIVNTVSSEGRGIEESSVEGIIRGPRDSFVENIQSNIGLVRRKLRNPSLKVKSLMIGSESHTTVSVLYMDHLVNKEVLKDLMNKLGDIPIDGIFDSGYIEQLLEKSTYSPFPQMQITERPDKVCGNLLEGRIAILTDGSPIALILPISFWQLFQSSEDYYERLLYGNFARILRFIGFILATSLPSIYVALISFHHEMLPMDMIVDLSRTRAAVPFPPVVEAILMEVTIELLREASARLPGTIGQTIGIVGAIVIGDAAIRASLASPTMIIVVAITALGSYVLPHYSTSYALRMIRFPIIIMSALLGAFGIIIAWTWIIIHLCSLDSFGYPYLSPLAPLDSSLLKDSVLRGSLRSLKHRPRTVNKKHQRRW